MLSLSGAKEQLRRVMTRRSGYPRYSSVRTSDGTGLHFTVERCEGVAAERQVFRWMPTICRKLESC